MHGCIESKGSLIQLEINTNRYPLLSDSFYNNAKLINFTTFTDKLTCKGPEKTKEERTVALPPWSMGYLRNCLSNGKVLGLLFLYWEATR